MGRGVLPIYMMEVAHEKKTDFDAPGSPCGHGAPANRRFCCVHPEEALGEVQIYNGGVEMSYLSINGRIRSQIYTYYNYDNGSGSTREIPAYCVNPNTLGVPQTVGVGESIEYLADEKASDPKVVGIVANGYPTRSLAELGLENKYQATTQLKWPCGVIFSATGTSTTSRSIPT